MSYPAMLATHPRRGVVEWIGPRPRRRSALSRPREVRADPASGLEGDHYAGKTNRQRQVTLLQREHLAVAAALLGKPVSPETLRRNLVIKGSVRCCHISVYASFTRERVKP